MLTEGTVRFAEEETGGCERNVRHDMEERKTSMNGETKMSGIRMKDRKYG